MFGGSDPKAVTARRSLILAAVAVVLFIAPWAIAISLRQLAAALLAVSLLLPVCGLMGHRNRSANFIRAFCCWTGFVGVLFVIGATTLLGGFKTQLTCVCDISCTSISTPGGPGGGGSSIDPWTLRNQTRWQDYCSNQSGIVSSMNVYVALGAIAMLLQCAACCMSYPLASEYSKGPGDYTPNSHAAVPVAVPVGVIVQAPQQPGALNTYTQPNAMAGAPQPYASPYATPYASPYAVPQQGTVVARGAIT